MRCVASAALLFWLSNGAAAEGVLQLASGPREGDLAPAPGLPGFMPEIVDEAFRRIGLPARISILPWARCLVAARFGAVQGIIGASRTPQRERDYLFSDEPLALETESLFVRAGDPDLGPLGEDRLAEAHIAIISGSSFGPVLDEAIKAGKFHHLERTSSIANLLHMLLNRRVDYIALDRMSVLRVAKIMGVQKQIREMPAPLFSGSVFLAFTRERDMTDIRRAFDQALRVMKKDGSYDRIFAKYAD